MSNKFLEKVVKFFNVMGIAASSIYGLLIVLELLTEWYENGTLLRVWNFISKTFLFCTCLLLMWVLHSLAMFAIDKLFSKHTEHTDKEREGNETHKRTR